MEALGIRRQPLIRTPSSSELHHHLHLMNHFSANNFRAVTTLFFLRSSSSKFRALTTTTPPLPPPQQEEPKTIQKKKSTSNIGGRRVITKRRKVSCDNQLKEEWLNSLTYPLLTKESGSESEEVKSEWVIGIDPDVSGALALLKTDNSGSSSAQVFDSPHLKVLVGKRIRQRLDTKSIIELIQSFGAPSGTTAYLEQSLPYPQDGKQGWWSGGFSYGLWIGVLVASGFTVVPVPSLLWKNEFKLSGNGSSKDDSRELASTLFPSLCYLLKRKKDHGRAEALLIAAYGKGLKLSCSDNSSCNSEDSVVSQK
ncbi:hypothetical protein LguiA_012909 [Lonicera macranthoides]